MQISTVAAILAFTATTAIAAPNGEYSEQDSYGSEPEAHPVEEVYTTETVHEYVTYCPGPTQITHGTNTYTVTEATSLTLSEGPYTISTPVYSSAVESCYTCSEAPAANSAVPDEHIGGEVPAEGSPAVPHEASPAPPASTGAAEEVPAYEPAPAEAGDEAAGEAAGEEAGEAGEEAGEEAGAAAGAAAPAGTGAVTPAPAPASNATSAPIAPFEGGASFTAGKINTIAMGVCVGFFGLTALLL